MRLEVWDPRFVGCLARHGAVIPPTEVSAVERVSRTRKKSAMATARAKQGLSQEDLAHDAGLHRTYVGLIERGLRNPTIEVRHALALALGTTLSDLIRRAERRVGRS